MDWTNLLDYGIAAIIAFQMNRKIDLFITENRKMNRGLQMVFAKIVRSVDNHGQRLDRIEEFLVGEEDEPAQEMQVAGFQPTNSLAKS